mmetsp:Transcript_17554/g.35761  ORF Transcript_17554/g.35761 Transcript_17554/m.35761 type:complete len:339 (-) Transcript_17554:152-1168(-)
MFEIRIPVEFQWNLKIDSSSILYSTDSNGAMKAVVVHREPLTKRFLTSRVSFCYIFVALCNAVVLLVPLFVSFGNGEEFWIKHSTYREQPQTKFLYKFIMVMDTFSSLNGKKMELFISTIDEYNVLRPESVRMSMIEVNEERNERNGLLDAFTVRAEVPLENGEVVKRIQSFLIFDFRLQKRVRLDTDVLVYAATESSLSPISGYDSDGQLILRQSDPFSSHVADRKTAAYEPILSNEAEANATNTFKFADILKTYRARTVAADYVTEYPILHHDFSPDDENRAFQMKMKVKIPQQTIRYIPTLVEVLKDAWIKYLSVVIVCWYLMDAIKSFVFKHHL